MKHLNDVLKYLSMAVGFLALLVYSQDVPVWKMFLVKDFSSLDFSVLLTKDQEPLGQVSQLSGSNLKRKPSSESFFKTIRLKDQVFGGDIISTDSSTRAVIKFNDGGELEIQPQSMVKIDFHADKGGLLKIAKNPKVEVYSGAVKGIGGNRALKISNLQGQSLTVKSHATNTLATKKETLKTSISPEKVSKLNLPKPPPKPVVVVPPPAPAPVVKAPTPPPQPVKLAAKEPVKEEMVPKVKPKPVARKVASIPPPMGTMDLEPIKIAGLSDLKSNLYQGDDLRNFFVDLKWEEVSGANLYVLEFFHDELMTKSWFNVKTQNNFYRLTQVFNGKLYYKVKAFQGEKIVNTTKPSQLNFMYQGPELKNPKHKTSLESKEGMFYFTWEKTNFTEKYLIEISKDAEFTKVIKKEVDTNFVQIPLISGTYYWRVSSRLGDTYSTPSKVFSLQIK